MREYRRNGRETVPVGSDLAEVTGDRVCLPGEESLHIEVEASREAIQSRPSHATFRPERRVVSQKIAKVGNQLASFSAQVSRTALPTRQPRASVSVSSVIHTHTRARARTHTRNTTRQISLQQLIDHRPTCESFRNCFDSSHY